MENWLTVSISSLLLTALSGLLIFFAIAMLTRISGLRSFAKMSSFDFGSTIAIGSIIAAVILNTDQSILKGSVALGTVLLLQFLFSVLKRRSSLFQRFELNAHP